MTWRRLSEQCFVGSDLPAAPHIVADAVDRARLVGAQACVPAMDSVGLYVERSFDVNVLSDLHLDLAAPPPTKQVCVPTVYDGADLDEAAAELGISAEELIHLHSQAVYMCVCIGFCPGFPYLRGLPSPLDRLPRRPTPRTSVPAGSVSIAAGQCGIYPKQIPGGWWLLGTTQLRIADEESHTYLIEPGDTVVFERL